MANQWTTIGGNFPPTLNSYAPATALQPNETPAAYGLDSTIKGALATGSIPTGVAYTPSTVATCSLYGDGATLLGSAKWRKIYNRLWAMGDELSADANDNYLYFGAPYYLGAEYVPQNTGYYDLHNEIKQFIPLGQDSLLIITTAGSYVLSNCADSRAFFQLSQRYENLILPDTAGVSAQVVDLDGRVFICTADGVFEFSQQGGLIELSLPVRGDASFQSKNLTVDKDRKVLVGAASFAFDLSGEAPIIYDYSTSGFLYTTPSLRAPRGVPFNVQMIRFVFESTDGNSGTATMNIQRDPQRGWEIAQSFTLDPVDQKSGSHVDVRPETIQNAFEFSMKLTALSSNIRIKEILVQTDAAIERGYTGA